MIPTKAKPPKLKVCKTCKAKFAPQRPMAVCCSPFCALTHARSKRAKAEKVRLVKDRRETRAALEKHKKLPELIADAQKPFNEFIRLRDQHQPCICCGRTANDKDLLTGSRWDAGHYRSTGSASHLRFNEDNCHRQLVHCNRHGAGRAVDYRLGLIARIGLGRVEALESSNEVHKWTREELIEIKATYAAKVRALKARTE